MDLCLMRRSGMADHIFRMFIVSSASPNASEISRLWANQKERIFLRAQVSFAGNRRENVFLLLRLLPVKNLRPLSKKELYWGSMPSDEFITRT